MFVVFFILFTYSTANQLYFQGTELLSDVNYSQGFSVIPSCPPTLECVIASRGRLYNPFSTAPNKTASWQIAQWGSRSNLSTTGTFVNDGKSEGMQWATADKRFTIFQDGRIQMAVNAFHEYGGKYRALDAPWAHLLMQQDIGIAGGAVPLSQVNELRWNLDVQLLYMDQNIQPGYDASSYAAIFPLYMTIQNLVQGDPEYGKYFWLGICSYDDRVLMSPLYVNGDPGTASLIYTPAFSNFANISVHSQSIVHVTGDMMPYVRLGLQAAVERGFVRSGDLNKYYVGGMNIGWEISGLNIGTIEIGKFSLKQYTAQNPKSYEFNQDHDTEGWQRISDFNQFNNGPSNGKWILSSIGNDPQLLSPVLMIDTSIVKKIIINMVTDRLADNHFRLFWSINSVGLFSENDSISIQMMNDGDWREYILDLSNNSNWDGTIRRLRIDLEQRGNGAAFGIDYIRFAAR